MACIFATDYSCPSSRWPRVTSSTAWLIDRPPQAGNPKISVYVILMGELFIKLILHAYPLNRSHIKLLHIIFINIHTSLPDNITVGRIYDSVKQTHKVFKTACFDNARCSILYRWWTASRLILVHEIQWGQIVLRSHLQPTSVGNTQAVTLNADPWVYSCNMTREQFCMAESSISLDSLGI